MLNNEQITNEYANIDDDLMFFLTVHHELTIYWLPTWCTNYYLFI